MHHFYVVFNSVEYFDGEFFFFSFDVGEFYGLEFGDVEGEGFGDGVFGDFGGVFVGFVGEIFLGGSSVFTVVFDSEIVFGTVYFKYNYIIIIEKGIYYGGYPPGLWEAVKMNPPRQYCSVPALSFLMYPEMAGVDWIPSYLNYNYIFIYIIIYILEYYGDFDMNLFT